MQIILILTLDIDNFRVARARQVVAQRKRKRVVAERERKRVVARRQVVAQRERKRVVARREVTTGAGIGVGVTNILSTAEGTGMKN